MPPPRETLLESIDDGHAVEAWDVIQGQVNVGSRVVIPDWKGDWIGLGLAEKLAEIGCHVRLAVNGMSARQSIPQYARGAWLGKLHKLGVKVISYLRPYGVDADTAHFQHTSSQEPVIMEGVDTLVTSLGHTADTSLADALSEAGYEVHAIGDCLSPRTVEEAVLEGLKVAAVLYPPAKRRIKKTSAP